MGMQTRPKGPNPLQRVEAFIVFLVVLLAATHFGWTLKWKIIATWVELVYQFPVLGEYVSRGVLTLLYCFMFPFGLGVRLFSDPLRLRTRALDSHWVARAAPDESLTGASRQG